MNGSASRASSSHSRVRREGRIGTAAPRRKRRVTSSAAAAAAIVAARNAGNVAPAATRPTMSATITVWRASSAA